MDPRWRIELFGGLHVRLPAAPPCNGRVIDRFQTQRVAALLAYLACHARASHSREVVSEVLWPEEAPVAARHNLRQALFSLRRQLEPPDVALGPLLRADRHHVGLVAEAVTIDVVEFEHAVRKAKQRSETDRLGHLGHAVALYRGELLPGFYEEWVLPEQRRLAALCEWAYRDLIAECQEAGDCQEAIEHALRLVELAPLHEEWHRLLMRLYEVAGQPSSALGQYEHLRQLLDQGLHATPSMETESLANRLREKSCGAPRSLVRGSLAGPPAEPVVQLPCCLPPSTVRRSAPPSNLPLPLTSFFDRKSEIRRLTALLAPVKNGRAKAWTAGQWEGEPEGRSGPPTDRGPLVPLSGAGRSARLVTLTGPGGTGKTRLALEVARQLVAAFDGAVWYVPLQDVLRPVRIAEAVRDALRLDRSVPSEPIGALAQAIGQRPGLLMLDNLEHLLEGGAEWIDTLLCAVSDLRCLVTSRQRLDIAGEREFPVAPLAVPEAPASGGGRLVAAGWLEAAPLHAHSSRPCSVRTAPAPTACSLMHLLQCPSVALFVDRAQAARPDFQLTHGNAAAILELCRRLEGIPLAIELAAARAQLFSPARMLSFLAPQGEGAPKSTAPPSDRFELLVGRRRASSARQKTLRSALDWSIELLSPELRRFFARLSVFRGGWTLEAASAIADCGLRGYPRSGWTDWEGGAASPRSPEPERSAASGQSAIRNPQSAMDTLDALEQLRDASLVLAEETAAGEIRFRMLETLREHADECLDPCERKILRSRHADFCLCLAEKANRALAGSKPAVWLTRVEAEHENLRSALQWYLGEEPPGAGCGLRLAVALSDFWMTRGYLAEGASAFASLLERHATLPSSERALALCQAGRIGAHLGDYVRAEAWLQEGFSLATQLGDPRGAAMALQTHGILSCFRGDYEAARARLEESLATWRGFDDRHSAAEALHHLGLIALNHADHSAACAFLEESLAMRRDLGTESRITESLDALAALARRQGDAPAARRLHEESLRISREQGDLASAAGSLVGLGRVAAQDGDPGRARDCLLQAVQLYGEIGHARGAGWALCHLAHLALREGDLRAAQTLYRRSLASRQERDERPGIVECLEGLGLVAARGGLPERGVRLLAAAGACREALGHPPRPDQQLAIDACLRGLRERLDERALTGAWTAGAMLTLDQAIALALNER